MAAGSMSGSSPCRFTTTSAAGVSLRAASATRSVPVAPLERAERLEQLRALWNGIPIHVAVGDWTAFGIDTPEDLEHVREMVEKPLMRAQS